MGRHTIGIDVGGTATKLVRLQHPGTVAARARVTSSHEHGEELVAELVAAMQPWHVGDAAPDAIGVALPGLVDRAAGHALTGSNLAYLDEFPIVAALREATGLPVELDNDANAAGLAEARLGAARGCHSAICLTVGWGVGAALVFDRRLWRGHTGMAGEVGRLLLEENAERSLEAGAGAGGIVAAYRAGGGELEGDTDVATVAERAAAGDDAARRALALAGRRLGIGMAILVNVINPERIVVGGGIVRAGEWFLEPARQECGRRARGPAWDRTAVVEAALGADAGAIGAALLCDSEPTGG